MNGVAFNNPLDPNHHSTLELVFKLPNNIQRPSVNTNRFMKGLKMNADP
jgi:hypothetical protein